LQWVVTIYTLMFSVLLLFAGTLSDRVGAHKAYAAGMVLFLLALAAYGLAPTLPVLIGARSLHPPPAERKASAAVHIGSTTVLTACQRDVARRARQGGTWETVPTSPR
jgi:MFS transporter, DHA2 family, methylenomycin A resistance protein